MNKKRLGLIIFECCEGCKNIILQSKDFIKCLDQINMGFIDENTKAKDYDNTDIFAIIGIPKKDYQKRMLKLISKNKKIILIGTCTASLVKIKDEDFRVFMDEKMMITTLKGCPVEFEDFLESLKDVNAKKRSPQTVKSVCYECTLNHNECFLEKGELCLGPFTVEGCNSVCINNSSPCLGCRTFVRHPKKEAVIERIMSGKSKKDAEDMSDFFNKGV